jgi:transcription antitermination factor NusG
VRLLDLKIGDRIPHRPVYKPEPVPSFVQLRWRVLITAPGQERLTRERLLDLKLNLKPYVPLEHKQIAAGRHRKREVDLPMFKSYIFLPMPDINDIWHEVRHVRGVQDFLSDAAQLPKMVSPAEIERVRSKELQLDAKRLQRLAAGGHHPIGIGTQVWITDLLPFQALLGLVRAYDERGRAVVGLEQAVLGRKFFPIEPHRLQLVD